MYVNRKMDVYIQGSDYPVCIFERTGANAGFSFCCLGVLTIEKLPPLQGEARSGGGLGRGCEKSRSDNVQNEL